MKIVNKTTLLSMPKGTIYREWGPDVYGEPCVFVGAISAFDFNYYPLFGEVRGEVPLPIPGRDVTLSLGSNITRRDGMFRNSQLYAVSESREISALMVELSHSLKATR